MVSDEGVPQVVLKPSSPEAASSTVMSPKSMSMSSKTSPSSTTWPSASKANEASLKVTVWARKKPVVVSSPTHDGTDVMRRTSPPSATQVSLAKR